jgi:peptidoglycan/LPS O-acetylase OafA/YrhL
LNVQTLPAGPSAPIDASPAMERPTFATLDGLRFVAALAVFLAHDARQLGLQIFGLFAVDLFFVMSGFVIALSYERKLLGGMSVSNFIVVRALRLYPLYILGILLGCVAALLAADISAYQIATSFAWSVAGLPTPGASDALLYPLNPVAWSLFFEMIINVVFALTVSLWTRRNLMLWCAASALLLMGFRVYYHQFDIGWSWGNAAGGAARVAFGFPLGVLLYRFWERGDLPPLRIPASLVPLASAIVLLWEPSLRILEALSLFVLVPLVACLAVCVEPKPSQRRLWILGGSVSYALYTLHFPLLRISDLIVPSGVLMSGAIVAALILIGAYMADVFYDKPVRQYLRARFAG